MDPATIGLMLNGAKTLWGLYKDVEAKNSGLTPEQLKARLDSLDDVVRQNFQIIERLSVELEESRERLILQADEIHRSSSAIDKLSAKVASFKVQLVGAYVFFGVALSVAALVVLN